MTHDEVNKVIESYVAKNAHSKPSTETLEMIQDFNDKLQKLHDLLFGEDERDGVLTDIKNELITVREQTVKTNGRVSKLEMWRMFILGGLSIVTVLIVPLILYVLTRHPL